MKHALAAALLLALATTAHAEAPRALADAGAAAAAGDWPRVQQLLAPLQTLQIAIADRAEVERLSGLAAFFQNVLPSAEQHFLAFLRLDPDGSLDPALYPPEALAFFEGVKTRHRAEITAQRPPPHRSIWLNLIPVAGQAQNGELTKGIVIGGVIGGLLVAQLTTYLVLHSWCDETSDGGMSSATCDDNSNHVHAATELRTVNLMLGGAAILTYAYGVYDGISHYRARSRELQIQPFATTSEHASEHTTVFGIAGSF